MIYSPLRSLLADSDGSARTWRPSRPRNIHEPPKAIRKIGEIYYETCGSNPTDPYAALRVTAVCLCPAARDRAHEPMQFMTATTSGLDYAATFGEYDFNLYNRTSGWVLNGFYTQEDGKWSKNG